MSDHSSPPAQSGLINQAVYNPGDSGYPTGHSVTGRAAPDRLAGTALCALSAAGFASLTILGKLAFQLDMNLVTILGLRFGVAASLLAIFLKFVKGQRIFWGWRLTAQLLLLGGVGYAGQSALYFASLNRNPASINSLLLYVYPVFVALLSWRFNLVRPSRREFGALVIASTGVLLTIGVDFKGGSLETSVAPVGVVLVLASAAWYAAYIIASDRFVHSVGPWVSTTWIAAGAGSSFLLAGLFTGTFEPGLSLSTAAIILGMVLLSTIMALGTFLAGVRIVGPTTASLLSTLEPVFTVVLAMVILQEHLSTIQVSGGFLVLVAVVLLTLPGRPISESTYLDESVSPV